MVFIFQFNQSELIISLVQLGCVV